MTKLSIQCSSTWARRPEFCTSEHFIITLWDTVNMYKLTSTIVFNSSCDDLITIIVFSQHRLNTPSTPVPPIPSTRSRVNRNGINSGVGRVLPCSNATPINYIIMIIMVCNNNNNTQVNVYQFSCLLVN